MSAREANDRPQMADSVRLLSGDHHSDFRLFGHLKRVVNLDAEISDGTFKPVACRQ
ncbi:hypothetical protein HDG37_001368 [Paraburkholderia sp. MM5384-R2]|nr:hypothetical protein [Paraburkholderia sp. MM5384-R2]